MYDAEAVSRELVRALRGDRSQEQLNRRLRYGSNVVYQWESGRRKPSASAFFWLAHRVGADLEGALGALGQRLSPAAGEPWTLPGLSALIGQISQRHSPAALAAGLGTTRHRVGRWLRGEGEPPLPDLLRLVELCTARSLDLLERLVAPSALPSAADALARRQAARCRVHDEPWSAAVQLALELDRYRALGAHQDGWIAAQLGLPVETERACLAALVEAGDVVQQGGLYQPVEIPRINLAGQPDPLRLRRFWAAEAMARARADGTCKGGWNLFTLAQADVPRVAKLQREYFVALRGLVEQSQGADVIMLATMQVQVLGGGEG